MVIYILQREMLYFILCYIYYDYDYYFIDISYFNFTDLGVFRWLIKPAQV